MLAAILLAAVGLALAGEDHSPKPTVPSDFRFTSYEDLVAQVPMFENDDVVSYPQLTIDEARDQLLVGARDCLFRLSLDNLDNLETAHWSSDPDTTDTCLRKGKGQEDCRNFIRVLLVHNDQVFVCGTNAFAPSCTWRPADNLTVVEEELDGVAKCPYNPHHNATALMTANGDLYTATVIDITARDPAINRNLGPSRHLRTMQRNSKWLNEPNFVSTYEIGDFVYFFFRENAVEYINCGKKIYSRVARICKNDKGGNYLLEDNWTTFLKARINCSIPGEYPFYYDELQATFFSPDRELLYAIFTTPPNSMPGTAVCVFNMTSLEEAFVGAYKYQDNAKAAWIRHDNLAPYNTCRSGVDSKRSSEKSPNRLVTAQQYQLMDQTVQPTTLMPLLRGDGERWTHLVVDHVTRGNTTYDVVFLATADGRIRKMLARNNQTCLLEEIKIVPNGEDKPVKSMKIVPNKRAIYISTHGKVMKIPCARCQRFADADQCFNARDPYCGWDSIAQKCTEFPEDGPRPTWQQHIESCPILEYPIDGGYSPWSAWGECVQVGSDSPGDKCRCRSRACDSPAPFYGGRPCRGPSVEVTNCTVHGQWTEWGAWSSCSQTCGFAMRSRSRVCGNPSPKHGGRPCEGEPDEQKYCQENQPCPEPAVDGKWSDWSGWSKCTGNCNGGIQTRRRLCDNPEPSHGGVPCIGNKNEWRMCNNHTCNEVRKMTEWSPWMKTNLTSEGHYEQRFRFMCRAHVPNKKLIKSSFYKSQARFCFKNGRGCYRPGELKNTITSIDTFSSVDRMVKKFCRFRRKLFKKYCNCRTLGVFLVCQKCGYG